MVTRQIKHKQKDGSEVTLDIGALAANVETDESHQFVTQQEKEAIKSPSTSNITDWNQAVKNGWYAAANAANAPVESASFYGFVVSQGDFVRQILYQYAVDGNVDGENCDKYERIMHNKVWGPWVNTSVKAEVPNLDFSEYARKPKTLKTTIPHTAWTGTKAPYTATITVDALTGAETEYVEVFVPYEATTQQKTAWAEAGVASGDNKAKQLILEALGDKPGIDIPITLIVREE